MIMCYKIREPAQCAGSLILCGYYSELNGTMYKLLKARV